MAVTDNAARPPLVAARRWRPVLAPSNPALLVIGALIVGFVGYPVAAGLGIFEPAAFARLLSAQNVEPLLNSLLAAALSIVPAAVLGVPLACLCARTNLPGRNAIGLLVSVSFVIPNLLTSIAYVFLFGRNSGLVNVLFYDVLSGPLYDIYSFSGVVFIAVLHSYPLIFFTTLSGLSKINPELEEAGRICGLSPVAVFFRITLGAILPSVMAGVAFSVAESLTMLAGPLVLGSPVGLRFMTTEMYATIVMNPNLPAAVALSLPLVAITVLLLWLQARLLGGAGSAKFAVLSGKGARSEIIDLGRWRIPMLLLALVPVMLSLGLPVLTLLAAALMDQWWRGLDPDNFTLANFAYLFSDQETRLAVWNSALLSVGIGAVMALLGGVLAIVLSGPQSMGKRFLRQLSEFPLGLPHVVAGVLVILAWYGSPFHLGGTLWILAFGYVLVMLPYALKTCEAARGQIDTSLAEAAHIVGCSQLQAWRYVLMPLMKNGLLTTFVLVFLFVVKEFSLTAMVYSAETQTLAVRVFTYFEGGSYEKTAAAAILLLVLTFGGLAVAGRLLKVSLTGIKV
jgi:iron(III) transport system permease protein